MDMIKNSTDLSSGRRPDSKSDEGTHIGILSQVWLGLVTPNRWRTVTDVGLDSLWTGAAAHVNVHSGTCVLKIDALRVKVESPKDRAQGTPKKQVQTPSAEVLPSGGAGSSWPEEATQVSRQTRGKRAIFGKY
eukprot:4438553-Prymnesium_polylepis.3